MTVLDASPVLRPQPLGVFEGPAALLVVGPGDGVPELLDALARGRVPDAWPPAAAVFEAARRDDTDAALAALGEDAVSAVNRFVLAPTPRHHRAALDQCADVPELVVVVDAAAYASGLSDRLPGLEGTDGEFAALAMTVAASDALARGDGHGAVSLLRAACASAAEVGPALHGRAIGVLAEHLHQLEGPNEHLRRLYDDAIALLAPTSLDVVRAGLQLQRAVVTHELAQGQRHLLVEAIRSYQSALIVLDETHHGEAFAFANMNIALAILALPTTQASDQVRLGVAVQSLRAALRIYTPESHPQEWSSAQLNLANALQYLPSRHREENLIEAVTLYEALLGFRSPRHDPVGYARVLANQANALAHLGVFDHAEAKYHEARDSFARAGDTEAVAAIAGQLDEIARQRDASHRPEGTS